MRVHIFTTLLPTFCKIGPATERAEGRGTCEVFQYSSGFPSVPFVAKLERRPDRKKVRRKLRTDEVQTAEETSMAVTYYVALPFIRTEDGTAPGEAQECQSEAAAIRRAEGMSSDPANAGAVAFKRAGDPNVGEFSDAVALKKFGDVPNDLSEL
jgi:hypothetical protein